MKNLIALCAVLLLLMTFPIQYAMNIKNHYRISLTQKYVNNAKEEARQLGYFSDDIIIKLKDNISLNAQVDLDDIEIEATDLAHRKERGELVYYKVKIPLYSIIATPNIWGVNDEDNYGAYVIENYAPSEWLLP